MVDQISKMEREFQNLELLSRVSRATITKATPPGKRKKVNYGLQRDYKVLTRQKTVSSILSNLELRSKLESILQDQVRGKKMTRPDQHEETPGRYLPPDQPHPRAVRHALPLSGGAPGIVIPIDDLDESKYSPAEALVRCKLASMFRLADLMKWCCFGHEHMTALSPSAVGGFFINPRGLLFYEVTASSLVHVTTHGGQVTTSEGTSLGTNVSESGAWLHFLMYRARSDVGSMIHLWHTAVVAVSSMRTGLLPMSPQAANLVGKVVYCESALFQRDADKEELTAVLQEAKVVVLRGCGMLALGADMEEAFGIAQTLVRACEIQVAALAAGPTGVLTDTPPRGWGIRFRKQEVNDEGAEFQALLRMLDRMGLKTGCSRRTGKELGRAALVGVGGRSFIKGHQDDASKSQAKSEHASESYSKPRGEEESHWRGLEDVTITAQRVAKSTGEALNELEAGEDQSLHLSKKLTDTAQRVALSTEQELERVRRKKNEELQSLSLSDQLTATAQRVAWSTGEMVEKAKMAQQEEQRKGHDSLKEVREIAQHVAKSTGEAFEKASKASPPVADGVLKQVERTAERIARSTSSALETLARGDQRETKLSPATLSFMTTPSHNLCSPGSLEDATLNYALNRKMHPPIKLLSLPPGGHREADELGEPKTLASYNSGGYARYDGVLPHQTNAAKKTRKKNKPADSESTSSEFSTTESSDAPAGLRSRSLLAHRQSIVPDPELTESPLQRMTHTAELVAASTGQAVLKLTSSLLP